MTGILCARGQRLLDRWCDLTRTTSSAGNSGLKWVRVSVPQYRIPGESATCYCDYDLGNDTLYAVKWYKEHEEFYRFVPKARPQKTWYKVEGVHVDVSVYGVI
ncbi:unnamed protein product [Acanthoscelides obtectus]|uniref:Ig-like domain-containing protein n=1 Tax=Acanthoscelides obtectus TaxID=200917 RepID=A0A9P0VNL5_ACAOB|nr:unnamed protein product [Acanthoscelides obtectus]CAK1659354.1 hypothetical protein AOBTE_LOCUS21422 [Acanthoscelides obtectus]